MPKYIKAGLTDSTTLTYGDTSKTYLAGRVRTNTIMGKDVVAPPLVSFADIVTTFGVAPGHCIINPVTGRKFELQNVTTNSPTVLCFNFDTTTGTWSYIGKIIMTLPAGVHSYRGFDFDDSNPSNIKVMISSTVTTALCQGGTFYTWNVALSDFTISGTTIPTATGSNQKAVYFAQYAGQLGLNHTGTTSGGVAHGKNLATVANQTKFFQQNGTAAAMQIYGWDTSITSTPTVNGAVTNGVASSTTGFVGTSPLAYFSMGASQNGYSTTANTAAAFESVVLINGTTNIPTNFTASPFGTAQTIYYMRDLQLVAGTWYFNLATTAVGAAVVPATASATFSMTRQGGISSSHSLLKTGNISPALTGTILQSNCFGTTIPTSVPAAPAINGQDSLFLATNTSLYLGKVSDLADSSTSWSTLSGVNLLGTGVDVVTPTATLAQYSQQLDRWIYVTNTSKFIVKPHQNNLITRNFGALSNLYLEAQSYLSVPAGLSAIITLASGAGWMFITGSATGQRGVVACDLYSDDLFGYSYIISKVMRVPVGSKLRFFTTDEGGADYTGDVTYYIRSATTATDAIFNSVTGGWVAYNGYQDEAPDSIGPFFQIKVGYNIIVDSKNISPAQLHDIIVCYDEPGEIDKNFVWSSEYTTQSGNSPMTVGIRQITALTATPTKFLLVGYDDSGNAQVTIDSSVTPSAVSLSSNSGASFTTFTSMANFMSSYNSSSGNTVIKFTVTSPPAVTYLTWSFTYA